MSVLRFLRSKIPSAHHEARARDKDEFFAFAKVHHQSRQRCTWDWGQGRGLSNVAHAR